MLLTVSTTHVPASDLGYLLHKHPDRVQAFEVSVGTVQVFYPEVSAQRCTAAMLLEVDPVGLVRGHTGRTGRSGRESGPGSSLAQYVNDRPYAASSMLSVALAKVFGTAMAGRCDARPELAAASIPLELRVPALPCLGGPELAARLFEPLGWRVLARPIPLDEHFPAWGESRYVDLRLTGECRLADALSQLYVLLPVLDDAKHYWVSTDEVDKLIRAGAGWLAAHPEQEMISRRYLAHRGELARSALARLAEVDDADPEVLDNALDAPEVVNEPDRPVPLAEQRRGAVLSVLRASGAHRVADLGCGEGDLLAALLDEPMFTEVIGTDVSARALAVAARKLRLDRMPQPRRERLRLFQSSLTYRDARLTRLDAAVLMEVIEHVDPPRHSALERVVFGHAAPETVVVTTPNAEYNVRFEFLAPGTFRHRDHRFEWTRAEFRGWAQRTASAYGYGVRYLPVGTGDPEVGPPTQLAVFTKDTKEPA